MTGLLERRLHGRSVLVTGGCGIVGSSLVRRLVALGADVTALDNHSAYPFDAPRMFGLLDTPAELVEGDVADAALVARLCQDSDFVIHAAALADVAHCTADADADFRANVVGAMNVLRAAQNARLERLVFVSSASVYGGSAAGRFAEDAPCAPVSTYANSKLWAERQALLAHRTHGLPVTCVRYFSVYGPPQVPKRGSHSWCVAIFAMRALTGLPLELYGDGRQVRDFTHLDDIVTGTLLGMVRRETVGEVYNLGTGVATEVATVAALVREMFGEVPVRNVPRRADDPLGAAADTTKMEALLGWRPAVALEEGMRDYRDWLLATPAAIPDWLLREAGGQMVAAAGAVADS